MATQWKACVAVFRSLATHRDTYRFLALLLSVFKLCKAVQWSNALGVLSAFYLMAVTDNFLGYDIWRSTAEDLTGFRPIVVCCLHLQKER